MEGLDKDNYGGDDDEKDVEVITISINDSHITEVRGQSLFQDFKVS